MPELRRILVALDAGLGHSQLPEVAAALAAQSRAEIEALLVESEAVTVAAGFAFTQEILAPTGARRALTREALDLDFAVAAHNLALRLQRTAGEAGLHWALRTPRGTPIAEIAASAKTFDLLMLALQQNATRDPEAMRRIARRAGRPALFLSAARAPAPGLAVLEEPGAPPPASLVTFLARIFPGGLKVYRPREDEPVSADLRALPVLILPGRQTSDSDGGGPEIPKLDG